VDVLSSFVLVGFVKENLSKRQQSRQWRAKTANR
jgi:hypothetical protein